MMKLSSSHSAALNFLSWLILLYFILHVFR
uniref:Uncharacterized protein n=1 Tax=Arundo donax TaxID=35708 RepID=A0A0A9ARA8_ARUDO